VIEDAPIDKKAGTRSSFSAQESLGGGSVDMTRLEFWELTTRTEVMLIRMHEGRMVAKSSVLVLEHYSCKTARQDT
jgi:hypothetical protein